MTIVAGPVSPGDATGWYCVNWPNITALAVWLRVPARC